MVLINAWFSESSLLIRKPTIIIEYLDDNNVMRFTSITKLVDQDEYFFTEIYSFEFHAILSSTNTHNFFEFSARRKGISDLFADLEYFVIGGISYRLGVLARVHCHSGYENFYLSDHQEMMHTTFVKVSHIFRAIFDSNYHVRSDLVIE